MKKQSLLIKNEAVFCNIFFKKTVLPLIHIKKAASNY